MHIGNLGKLLLMTNNLIIEKIKLQTIEDDCVMCIAESGREIDFDIKRVYYTIKPAKGLPRGFHAHKKLKQILFCIQGSMKMILDNGFEKKEVILNNPSEGILLSPMIWHEMHDLDKETIMLVMASGKYDESGYIRSYSDFKKLTNKLKTK